MSLILLQNPKTQRFFAIGSSQDQLTSALSSGACAGMPLKWLHAIRYLVLRDDSSAENVHKNLLNEANRLNRLERWKLKNIVFFVDATILDYAGKLRFKTEDERAAYFGYSRASWFRKYKNIHARLVLFLHTWEECAESHIKSHLFGRNY